MYANYSKWIQKEIDGSKEHQKPILAVTVWGKVRESGIVKAASTRHVKWNSQSVVDAIISMACNGRK